MLFLLSQRGLVEGSKCPFGYKVSFDLFHANEWRIILIILFVIVLLNLQKESIGDGKCPAGFSVRSLQIVSYKSKNVSFYILFDLFLFRESQLARVAPWVSR